MIKIYDMNEVRDQDIFLRHDAVKDVSQPPSTTTPGSLIRWSCLPWL